MASETFGLARRTKTHIWLNNVGASMLVAQIVTAIVCAITLGLFGISGSNYGTSGAQDLLVQTYHHVIAKDTTPKAFPSLATVNSRLKESQGLVALTAAPAADYAYLRRHGGSAGTVYVKSVSPTRLELVGRVHHDAIEEMDIALPAPGVDSSTFHALYTGHLNWPLYWWIAALEALLVTLLGAALGNADAQDIFKARRRWHSVVADPRLGPSLPEDDYRVLLPHCEDSEEAVAMTLKSMTWDDQNWVEEKCLDWEYPDGLSPVTVPRSEGVAKVSGQWFDFCAQVAEVNAALWAQTLGKRERAAAAQRAAEARALEEAEEQAAATKGHLAPVLAPATALMLQALDAQPLEPQSLEQL
jgi:hypothetical protein